MNRDATDTAKRKRTAIRLAFAAAFALEAAWLFFADFGSDIPCFASQISAGIDALIAAALAAVQAAAEEARLAALAVSKEA